MARGARRRVGVLPTRLHLRTRITVTFALGALLLSALLAGTTYIVTRGALLRQREQAILRQAYVNARTVQDGLQTASPDVLALVTKISKASNPIVVWHGEETALNPALFGIDVVPSELVSLAKKGNAARMRTSVRNERELIVAIPLGRVDAVYYEIVSLSELTRTLRSIGLVLLGASALTTTLGVLSGISISGRAVRPLADAARAAGAIAGGRLGTRLEEPEDPDLRALTTAFNDMARALERRVERDARFASDVSHELRSPLMTLSASAEVLHSRRDELPARAAAALDLLVADLSRFQGLVEDLLEISRFDAGAVRLHLEEVRAGEFVQAAVALSDSGRQVPVTVEAGAAFAVIAVDKRRLARAMANLLDNARFHAGGSTAVGVAMTAAGRLAITVDDAGPGVPPDERELIFERFSRGAGAGRRSTTEGAGLGLSLVAEHVRMHGGRVWVEDLAGTPGARFVIELPVVS